MGVVNPTPPFKGGAITGSIFGPTSGVIGYGFSDGKQFTEDGAGNAAFFDGVAGYVFKFGTSTLAFYGANPAVKQTVAGSKGANAALTSLMAALVALGLVTDTTT